MSKKRKKKKKKKQSSIPAASSTKRSEPAIGEAFRPKQPDHAPAAPRVKRRAPRQGWGGFWYGPVDPVRPWLLSRLLLMMVAFDCWLDLVPHGGRYGFNDFNVAHFRILDALQPVPSSGFYVGTILLTGFAAFVMALSKPNRLGLAAVFGLYTYAWMMSMLDSYQHHYLISLLLFALIFFPRVAAADVFPRSKGRTPPSAVIGGALFGYGVYETVVGVCGGPTPLGLFGPGAAVGTPAWIWMVRVAMALGGGLLAFLPEKKPDVLDPKKLKATAPKRKFPEISAWGYVLLGVTCAIVYFYTAVGKLSPDWRDGHALQRLGRSEHLSALLNTATTEGLPLFGVMEPASFWKWMAAGAILVQFVTCAGYIAGSRYEVLPRWGRWALAVALGAPISFHIGAELGLSLDIGWFSFYMILVPLVFFLPAVVLRRVSEGAALASGWVQSKWPASLPTSTTAMVTAVAGIGVALFVGMRIDLPGAHMALTIGAMCVAAAAINGVRLRRAPEALSWAAGSVLALIFCWGSIAQSEARFDFYRFVGGEYRRHGEPERALDAYVKANRYVVSPWCLYRGRDLVECYRDETYAGEVAAGLEGVRVERRDRQRQEDEMRALVGAE